MAMVEGKIPEGGWGWCVVLGSCIAHFLFGCLIRAYAILYVEMLIRYECTATEAAWVGILSMSLWGFCGPLTSALATRFSCRSVTIAGGILMFLGVFGSAFSPNIYVLFLTFGVVGGVGTSFCYTPGYTMIGEYFDKKKGMAMGIGTIGSGIGTFVCPPLFQFLFDFYGYEGAMMIIAAILLHGCISGALYTPLRKKDKVKNEQVDLEDTAKNNDMATEVLVEKNTVLEEKIDNDLHSKVDLDFAERNNLSNTESVISSNAATEKDLFQNSTLTEGRQSEKGSLLDIDKNPDKLENGKSPEVKKSRRQRCSETFGLHLLKNPKFLIASISNIFLIGASQIAGTFITAHALDIGLSKTQGVLLVSVQGVADIFARILGGFLFDLKKLKPYRLHIYSCHLLLTGVAVVFMPVTNTYAGLLILVLLRGYATGISLSQRATAAGDLIGMKNVSQAFGLWLVCNSLGSLAGRAVGGLTKDFMNSYTPGFYIFGVLDMLCSLLFLASLFFYKDKPIKDS